MRTARSKLPCGVNWYRQAPREWEICLVNLRNLVTQFGQSTASSGDELMVVARWEGSEIEIKSNGIGEQTFKMSKIWP